tara:strand:+ start:393 stop:554 length:162 start_codon:yes stop_codon:yes gene_type:complete
VFAFGAIELFEDVELFEREAMFAREDLHLEDSTTMFAILLGALCLGEGEKKKA